MARTRKPKQKRTTTDDGAITVVGKNANGDGSVFYNAGKDRWDATFTIDGRRRVRSGPTEAEAIERRAMAIAELEEAAPHSVLGRNPTIAQLAEWWLTHVMRVRPNTADTYRNQVGHVTRLLGTVPIRSLSVEHVRVFMTELQAGDNGLSDHSAIGARGRLLQIVEEAVTLGFIDVNPVSKVAPPSKKKAKRRRARRILTAEEIDKLLGVLDRHRLGAAVAVLFLMGNRSSEVLGLAWGDIEIVTVDHPETGEPVRVGKATIRRGSTYSKSVGQRLDDPKTTSTKGVVFLPPSVIDLLDQRRQVQAVERLEADLKWRRTEYPENSGIYIEPVFTTPYGQLVKTQMLYKAVQDCCDFAGIDAKSVGTHTGRRTVITRLFKNGVPIDDIARLVGHGSTDTTTGYVVELGERPEATATLAAQLMDPKARRAG